MSKYEPKLNAIDQQFFDLLSGLDLEDLRTMRDDNYWWTTCIFTDAQIPRPKYEKLDLIRYYIAKGIPKPKNQLYGKIERMLWMQKTICNLEKP